MAPNLSFKHLLSLPITNKQTASKERAEPPTSTQKRSVAKQLSESFADMVGKSNKFDFTNRTSEGVKLGIVIADAFRKEVDKAQKDAERQAAKLRKQRTAGSAATDGGKDIGIHIIDFKAPYKSLGDDGIEAMGFGLYDAIRSGSEDACVCLEDINLQGNGLTVKSFTHLSPIVRAAMHHLQTLNLADNNITIVTESDAYRWELFLRTFQRCFRLRRIDLSGNKLGPKAFEVLARVYERESPITPLRLGGEISVYSFDEDPQQHYQDKKYALQIAQKGNKATPTEISLANGRMFDRRRGLRSLPYLDLGDTGLDDAGALWLSFVVPQHYFPVQLIDGINGAPATTSVTIYQQAQRSTGIEWSNNEDTIGRDGLQLLCRVETARKEALYDTVSLGSSVDMCSDAGGYGAFPETSRTSLVSHDAFPSRKVSGRFSNALTDEELDAATLDSIRHRIQRHIIQQHGLHSVDIWHSAITIVSLSRRLLILARPNERAISKYMTPVGVDHTVAGDRRSDTFLSCMSKPAPATTAMSDITNTPKVTHTDRSHGKSLTVASGPLSLGKTLEKTKISTATSKDYIGWQVRKDPTKLGDSLMPWTVPFRIFDNIIKHVMMDHQIDMLSVKQRRAAYDFGQIRTTLATGREWTKMNDSAQQVMLLDGIKCLAYEPQA